MTCCLPAGRRGEGRGEGGLRASHVCEFVCQPLFLFCFVWIIALRSASKNYVSFHPRFARVCVRACVRRRVCVLVSASHHYCLLVRLFLSFCSIRLRKFFCAPSPCFSVDGEGGGDENGSARGVEANSDWCSISGKTKRAKTAVGGRSRLISFKVSIVWNCCRCCCCCCIFFFFNGGTAHPGGRTQAERRW